MFKISYLYMTRKHLRDSSLLEELANTFKVVYHTTVPLTSDTLDFMDRFAFAKVRKSNFPDFVKDDHYRNPENTKQEWNWQEGIIKTENLEAIQKDIK